MLCFASVWCSKEQRGLCQRDVIDASSSHVTNICRKREEDTLSLKKKKRLRCLLARGEKGTLSLARVSYHFGLLSFRCVSTLRTFSRLPPFLSKRLRVVCACVGCVVLYTPCVPQPRFPVLSLPALGYKLVFFVCMSVSLAALVFVRALVALILGRQLWPLFCRLLLLSLTIS